MRVSLTILLLILIKLVSPFTTPQNPTWVANNAIRAGTRSLFSTVTLPGTYSYTISFSPSFSGGITPYLVYGIQGYRGKDEDIQELTI